MIKMRLNAFVFIISFIILFLCGFNVVIADNSMNISINGSENAFNNDITGLIMNNSLNNTLNSSNLTDENNIQSILQEEEQKGTGIQAGTAVDDLGTEPSNAIQPGGGSIQKYAQGGAVIDFDIDSIKSDDKKKTSAELSVHDHTEVYGYIRNLEKGFHYMGGEDPS